MTKEEILDAVYNKSYDSLDGYSQTTALKAMDEYAKQCVEEAMRHMDDYLYEIDGARIGDYFIGEYLTEKFKQTQ